jgi:predicted Zn-dependent peptidase
LVVADQAAVPADHAAVVADQAAVPADHAAGAVTQVATVARMREISSQRLPNGLPLHRVPIAGTRATTILVAFDAGARTERPDENGMAHFLEHLVFKGGEKYPTYREINQTAEGIGAVLNAYTSHDLVAFHITARAERAFEAADLLTDFVARPRVDVEELNRERGVVVQEIARAEDQPSQMAEHLIDEAVFGDHPLGRRVLGTVEHISQTFTREGILAFRSRRWSPARGGAFIVGNVESLAGADDELAELFGRFREEPVPEPFEPAPPLTPRVLVRERDSNQSHLRMSYRPGVQSSDPRERAALAVYSTLLGGSMASRLFEEIREKRGLAYSVHAAAHAHADVPILQMSAGLESSKLIEAYRCMRGIVDDLRDNGPKPDEVERARAFAAGARAIRFENSGAVATYAAQQAIVYGEDIDPDTSIELIDAVEHGDVRNVAERVSEELAVACVGPHTVEELESA